MEENLRKITEGKHIVLVGNSVEILQHDLADYIESFDTVVRFGNGIPTVENWDSIGTRTDIWVTGFLRYNKRRFFPKNIPVLFNRSRIHLDNLYCDEKHKIPFTLTEGVLLISKREGFSPPPILLCRKMVSNLTLSMYSPLELTSK